MALAEFIQWRRVVFRGGWGGAFPLEGVKLLQRAHSHARHAIICAHILRCHRLGRRATVAIIVSVVAIAHGLLMFLHMCVDLWEAIDPIPIPMAIGEREILHLAAHSCRLMDRLG